MRTTYWTGGASLFVALLVNTAFADDVSLTSGGTISGIVREESDWVRVEVPSGMVSFPTSQVDRIERKKHVLHEYYEKSALLEKSKDSKALYDLAAWAKEKGLTRMMTELSGRILALEPGHEGAHTLLGHEKREGSWLSMDEAKRADGLVRFQGRWIAAAERDRVLREEDQARQAATERYEQRKREEEERRKAGATDPARQGETLVMGIGSVGEPYHRNYSRYGRGRGGRFRGHSAPRPGSVIHRPGTR
jgi:hypothetical protein